MEANKEQAVKCKELGKAAFQSGDVDKAFRLLEKSLRMFPDKETEILMSTLKNRLKPSSTPPQGCSPNTCTDEPRPRPSAPSNSKVEESSSAPSSSSPTPAGATPEQEALCCKILQMKDHYGVLGVDRAASEDQIKKSYKKLAFQLHPDKNKSKNAEEAFKKISRAFQCLSDSSKRALYDQYGNDEDVPQQYRREYDADVLSPEELFEAFFGVDLGYGGQRRVYRRVRRTPPNEQQQRLANLVQMLPVFILLAITILSSWLQQPKPAKFEFAQSQYYPIRRTTQDRGVLYYVTDTFPQEFPDKSRQLRELEIEVEMNFYAAGCVRDQNARLWQMHDAYSAKRGTNRKDSLSNCRIYQELQHKHQRRYGSQQFSNAVRY